MSRRRSEKRTPNQQGHATEWVFSCQSIQTRPSKSPLSNIRTSSFSSSSASIIPFSVAHVTHVLKRAVPSLLLPSPFQRAATRLSKVQRRLIITPTRRFPSLARHQLRRPNHARSGGQHPQNPR